MMPIPSFTAIGDLPVGLHPATLHEVMARFGGEQAAIENWQIKRDGSLRGIVEIVGE